MGTEPDESEVHDDALDTGDAGSGDSGLGYPKNTKVDDMSPQEQAAYHRHQMRKAQNYNKSLKDSEKQLSKQLADAQKELEALRTANQTDAEKAITAAEKAGYEKAMKEAAQQIVNTQLLAGLKGKIADNKAEKLVGALNAANFLDADGKPDKGKIEDYLDAFSSDEKSGTGSTKPDMGQGRRNGGQVSGMDAGRAAYEKQIAARKSAVPWNPR